MRATNTSKGQFQLESGTLGPGKDGEFTAKEYEFLLRQGRVGPVLAEDEVDEPEILTTAAAPAPPKRPSRKKKAAEQPAGFL